MFIATVLVTFPFSAFPNSGDFDGGVAIGTGYAGVYTAPTNGIIVQGNIGIGTGTPAAGLQIYNATTPNLKLSSGQNSARTYEWVNDGNYLFFKDDTDSTGQFRIRANNNSDVAVFNMGAPAGSLVLTSSGNLGIGTSTPVNPLDVHGAVAIGTSYAGVNTAPTNGAIVQGNVGIGTASPQATLHVNGGAIVGNDRSSCSSSNAGEIIWTGSNLEFCNSSSWQIISSGSSPSGTWCGMGNNIYGSNVDCMGYDPQSGCPSGYSQALFAQYGGGALYVCVSN